MNDIGTDLIKQYERALENYIDGAGESALASAYELGRKAMADGLGVLQMGELHYRALVTVLSRAGTPETLRTARAAAEFFSESLAPYELAHRGYREAITTLRRLNEMLEQEARRIAYALHGEAAQILGPVHLALSEVMRELPPSACKRASEIRQSLEQIREHLRRLSHELHPAILDDLGLLPALRFLAEGVSKRTGLSIIVEGSLERRLPRVIETALYRIVQESLANAERHARAKTVKVALHESAQGIQCVIRDDGIGFDVSLVIARRGEWGLGLPGIRERLNALGGALQIDSAQGRGTEVRVMIPLEMKS